MPAVDSPQTVSDALHTATMMLARASDSARLDAELLLEHVTGLSRTAFRAAPERELPAAAGWSFQQLVKRRLQGEPVAYICGHQEFWSLLFEVTPAVLIPRPETELVVERALAHLATGHVRAGCRSWNGQRRHCAGDRERATCRAYRRELMHRTRRLEVAARNVARLQLANVTLTNGNWFAPLAGRYFDLVVANPPYIAADDPDLAPQVRRHEPGMALISGRTGMEAIAQIVTAAPQHLLPGGWLILEHGWKQAAAVRDSLVRAGFTRVVSHADLAGHERVTEGQRV